MPATSPTSISFVLISSLPIVVFVLPKWREGR